MVIYRQNGSHLLTLPTLKNEQLIDTSWTPLDCILYVTKNSNKVVKMEEAGKVTGSSEVVYPISFTVSDDIVYLACLVKGVFQSTDDGINWNPII